MSAQGPWFISPHAVNRYIERCRGGLTRERALKELIAHAETARYLRSVTVGDYGQCELWRTKDRRNWRLIVSREQPGLPQLVTVYGRGHKDAPRGGRHADR